MKDKKPNSGNSNTSDSGEDDISLAWRPAASSRQGKNNNVEDLTSDEEGARNLVGNEDDQPNSLRFRAPEPRKRNWNKLGLRLFWISILIGVVIGALFFALRFNKRFRITFASQGVKLAIYCNQQGLPPEIARGLRKVSVFVMKLGPKKLRASEKDDRLTGCAATIETLLDKKLRNSFTGSDFYSLGGCLLLTDRYELAKEYIKFEPLRNKPLKNWSDDELSQGLIGLEVYRRMDAFSFRTQIYQKYCENWKFDPNCFLRLVEEARQPIRLDSEGGFTLIEKKLNKELPNKSGWLNFAGGLIARKNKDFNLAELRFSKAQIIARSTHDKLLQREVFKARVKNLWEANRVKDIEQVWTQLPAEIYSEDPRSFLDVEYLRATSFAQADVKNLTAIYLERPESYLRFNDDFVFIKFVIYQGLKSKEYERVFGFLKNLEGQNIKGLAQPQNSYWLKLTKIRALYPLGAFAKIQEIYATIGHEIPDGSEIEHLIGLVRLKSRQERGALSLAAENFKKAIRLGSSEASSFALIVCLLEMKDLKGAEEVYRAWQLSSKGIAGDSWQIFAKGLLSYAAGDYVQANKLWNEIQHKDKSLLYIQVLMHNLRDDPGYMQGRMFEVLSQVLPVDSPLGALALFAQKA